MVRLFTANLIGFLALITLVSCNTSSPSDFPETVVSQSFPFIKRVDPETAHRGDTLTLFGIGFSAAPAENIIRIGPIAVTAATYGPNDSSVSSYPEKLTVTIPQEVPEGKQSVFVFVVDQSSNEDQTITIVP